MEDKVQNTPQRFCNNCNAKIEQGKDYCTACGTPCMEDSKSKAPLYKRFFGFCLKKLHWIILIAIVLAIAVTVFNAYFFPVTKRFADMRWYGDSGTLMFETRSSDSGILNGEIKGLTEDTEEDTWFLRGKSLYINNVRLGWGEEWECEDGKLTILGEEYYLEEN